jgi:hypothetical protein
MRPFESLAPATCLHSSVSFSVSAARKKLPALRLAWLFAVLLPFGASLPSHAQSTQSIDNSAAVETTPVIHTGIKRPSSAPPVSDSMPSPFLSRTRVQPNLTPVNTGPGVVYTCDPNVAPATCNYLNTTVAGYYNDTFTNANANIYIQYGDTGLASTSQVLNMLTYNQYVTALGNNPNKSAIQVSAVSALSTYDATPYGSGDVAVSSALGTALGFTGIYGINSAGDAACIIGSSGCYNAVITVISDPETEGFSLYYDNLGGTEPSNAYDFYGAVQHETDEVLGTTSCITTQADPLSDGCGNGTPSAVDLFRYSSAGHLVLDSSLSTTPGAYFSYNGGTTNGAIGVGGSPKFYNTLANGDDYADYVSSSPSCATNQAIQDAEGCPGMDAGLTILNDGGSEINLLTTVGYEVPANPSLSLTKSHTGNFTQGSTATWSIAVSNASGSAATTGTIDVSDTLPRVYTLNSYTSTGSAWACTELGSVACSSTTAIPGGSSSTINLTVDVPRNSPTSVSNTATAWGGGDPVHTSSGSAASSNTDTATVVQVPAEIGIPGSQIQSASAGTAFGSLAARVGDAAGAAIPSYSPVVFTAPVSGPSGTFSNSTNTISVSTNGSGVADPGTFTANGTGGGPYSVTVTAGTASNSFSLTNTTITPTLSWTPATTIIFGSAGTNVLNASASCGSACGTITYTASGVGDITSTTALAASGTPYTITANFTPSPSYPEYAATSATSPLTVSGESVWIVDGAGGTSELAANGYGITSSADAGANTAVAIDHAGNVWSAGSGPLLKETSQVGTLQNTITTGGGLNSPAAIAIDGSGQVWVTDGNNAVSLFSNAAAAISPSGGIADPTLLSTPTGIAIDLAGSVWIANKGNNTLTRILGAAVPAAPIATSAANNTTGAKP